MEFLVEFEVNVPDGTPESEVKRPRARRGSRRGQAGRRRASRPGLEAARRIRRDQGPRPVPRRQRNPARRSARRPAARRLDARHGHAARAPSQRPGGHGVRAQPCSDPLPDPRLTLVYRLEATLGEPLDLGDTAQGHRRIVPLTGGTFTGPEINGTLLPGASADWQIVLPDGTALGDIRYTLQTDGGDLLYVQSRGVRHGSAEVLARLARGEDVDAERVHLPHLDPDRDRRARARLAEQGRLHQRRRPPGRGRDLRDLPRRMSPRPTAEGRGHHRRLAGHRRRARRRVPSRRVRRRRHLALDRAPPTSPTSSPCRATSRDAETAQRVVEQALDRFGRIDTLINNAGIFIGKPFTDYTLDDYAAITAVNLAGFFHITQRVDPADGRPGRRPRRQHHHEPRRPRRQQRDPPRWRPSPRAGSPP